MNKTTKYEGDAHITIFRQITKVGTDMKLSKLNLAMTATKATTPLYTW